jgi:2-keto-4-pentenoate hydratase/2-oxohepta-3-ene-1,7-dioic acid hydratase in catechol pathway
MSVNGQARQKDYTKNMHFKIDDTISYVNQYIKFQEGDFLLTGTPDGVGAVKGGDREQVVGRIGDKPLVKKAFF